MALACSTKPSVIEKSQIAGDLARCVGKSRPSDGIYHTVRAGETLYRISVNYGVTIEEIARLNDIADAARIEVGQRLAISQSGGASKLIRPLEGRISSGFGRRGGAQHTGIDIPAREGALIKAAAAGLVVVSARSLDGYSGYGRIIEIEHGGGMRTVYAHNRRNRVSTGECVRAGEVIAEVGSSGRATGSHLHFELRLGGAPVDPARYLP
ncbi:MAG: peptidoglycan DD-metalloendopeptidase family protein [Deltaproteobacteria bacterium]